jgi:hypothetical protein
MNQVILHNTINKPYMLYEAMLTQTGTNDPVVTVLENTLNFGVTFERMAIGIYEVVCTPFITFDPLKTVLRVDKSTNESYGDFNNEYSAKLYFTNEQIFIKTSAYDPLIGLIPSDDLLFNNLFTFKVYF